MGQCPVSIPSCHDENEHHKNNFVMTIPPQAFDTEQRSIISPPKDSDVNKVLAYQFSKMRRQKIEEGRRKHEISKKTRIDSDCDGESNSSGIFSADTLLIGNRKNSLSNINEGFDMPVPNRILVSSTDEKTSHRQQQGYKRPRDTNLVQKFVKHEDGIDLLSTSTSHSGTTTSSATTDIGASILTNDILSLKVKSLPKEEGDERAIANLVHDSNKASISISNFQNVSFSPSLDLALSGSLGLMKRHTMKSSPSHITPRKEVLQLINKKSGKPIAVCVLKKPKDQHPIVRIYATERRMSAQEPATNSNALGLHSNLDSDVYQLFTWAEFIMSDEEYPKENVKYFVRMSCGYDGAFERDPKYKISHAFPGSTRLQIQIESRQSSGSFVGCAEATLHTFMERFHQETNYDLSVGRGYDIGMMLCITTIIDELLEYSMQDAAQKG